MPKRKIALVLSLLILIILFIPVFFEKNEEVVFNNLVGTSGPIAIDLEGKIPEISAKSVMVLDSHSLNVIYSKNADIRRGMASTTKIMTALVTIENCNPNDEFNIPKEAVGIEGSSVYLKEGEPLTVRELLYCLLLESGNDAATALAIYCGKTVENFAEMMNERAEELLLENTHFTNPHGLSDDNHYTTARELAIITAEAMKYPLFREISATKTFNVRYDGVENGRTLNNHNKLLKTYKGANGGKTGYTKKDGKCLVSSAERNGLEIIAVTLGDNSPTSTHTLLLDSAFRDYENIEIAKEGDLSIEIPVENGTDVFLSVTNGNDATVCLPKGAKVELELHLPDTLKAPIKKGEAVGTIIYRYNQKEIYIINIMSIEDINTRRKSLFERIFERQ